MGKPPVKDRHNLKSRKALGENTNRNFWCKNQGSRSMKRNRLMQSILCEHSHMMDKIMKFLGWKKKQRMLDWLTGKFNCRHLRCRRCRAARTSRLNLLSCTGVDQRFRVSSPIAPGDNIISHVLRQPLPTLLAAGHLLPLAESLTFIQESCLPPPLPPQGVG